MIYYLLGFHRSWKEERFHGWMQKFPTIGTCTSHESGGSQKYLLKYSFGNNISKLEVTMLAK